MSNFVNTPAGALQVRLTTAGTKDVLYDATPPAFAAGTGQTIVAYGRGSSKLVNVAIMASSTTGAIANSQIAQLKVANGTAVPAPLNVFVDGSLARVEPRVRGDRAVSDRSPPARARSPSNRRPVRARRCSRLTPNLVPATDNSIALSGTAGAMTALVLADSNPLIVPGRAQLRVVNISPDFAAVDVYANFGKIVSGLGPNAASAYSLVDAASAGTAYRFDFNNAGTTTVVLSVTGLTLASGHGYTIYLLGSGATLQGVLTQDR